MCAERNLKIVGPLWDGIPDFLCYEISKISERHIIEPLMTSSSKSQMAFIQFLTKYITI